MALSIGEITLQFIANMMLTFKNETLEQME